MLNNRTMELREKTSHSPREKEIIKEALKDFAEDHDNPENFGKLEAYLLGKYDEEIKEAGMEEEEILPTEEEIMEADGPAVVSETGAAEDEEEVPDIRILLDEAEEELGDDEVAEVAEEDLIPEDTEAEAEEDVLEPRERVKRIRAKTKEEVTDSLLNTRLGMVGALDKIREAITRRFSGNIEQLKAHVGILNERIERVESVQKVFEQNLSIMRGFETDGILARFKKGRNIKEIESRIEENKEQIEELQKNRDLTLSRIENLEHTPTIKELRQSSKETLRLQKQCMSRMSPYFTHDDVVTPFPGPDAMQWEIERNDEDLEMYRQVEENVSEGLDRMNTEVTINDSVKEALSNLGKLRDQVRKNNNEIQRSIETLKERYLVEEEIDDEGEVAA